jgi:multiple sugar transport system permease protein
MNQTLPRPTRKKLELSSIGVNALALFAAFLFLLPFYLVLRNAFMTDREITSGAFALLPNPIQWGNIAETLSSSEVPILLGLRNSALFSIAQTILNVIIAAAAGYGLARVPFRHKNLVTAFVLLGFLMPGLALFLPKYVFVAKLGWVDTVQGMIIPEVFSAFNAMMFRQFYLDFPKDIEEAGRLDGLDWLGTFWRLVIPNSLGVFMALGVLTFIGTWNSFLWPLVVGQSEQLWTVQVIIAAYNDSSASYHQVFMSALIALLPLLIVFIVMQRWIVQGIKLTGAKG